MPSSLSPRAYSYVRFSSDAQAKGDSQRRQRQASRQFADLMELDLQDDFVLDLGISAYTGENVASGALGRFIQAARQGQIPRGSYLLIESFDRLSRQKTQAAMAQFLELLNLGINVVTLIDKQIYTADQCDFTQLLLSLVTMQRAHEESATKSKRVGAAWSNKRSKAEIRKLTKRGPAWLILRSDYQVFDIIDERAQIIRSIFNDAIAGIGAYSIAKRLNSAEIPAFVSKEGWHTSSVNKVLTNRSVIGEFQPHKLINGIRIKDGPPIKDYFPTIIPQADFDAAQGIRSSKGKSGGGRKGNYISNLFAKIARCAYCGGAIHYENKGDGPRGGRYLICDNALRGRSCRSIRWRYDDFEKSFLALVVEIDLSSILPASASDHERSQIERTVKSISGKVAELLQRRESIFDLIAEPETPKTYISQKLAQCEQEITKLQGTLKSLEEKRSANIQEATAYYNSRNHVKDLIDQLSSRDGQDLYRLRASIATRLKALIRYVKVAPLGHLPLMSSSREDPGDIAPRSPTKTTGGERDRYFEVMFKDGMFRIVFPNPNDPLKYDHQFVRSRNEEGSPFTDWTGTQTRYFRA